MNQSINQWLGPFARNTWLPGSVMRAIYPNWILGRAFNAAAGMAGSGGGGWPPLPFLRRRSRACASPG